MFSSRFGRLLIVVAFAAIGIWLFVTSPSGPTAESITRQRAVQSFAPVPTGRDEGAEIGSQELSFPTVVNLAKIPAGVYDPNNQYDLWVKGEIDLDHQEGIVGTAELAAMQAASLKLEPSDNVQLATSGPGLDAPAAGISFDSLDYTDCCGGGGNVPPDPELAVGPSHVIAVVNVAFQIYGKNGNSLAGPTTFASFMDADSDCTGVFDPNVLYDEEADRFILGIDADGTDYCIAVSQTPDPTSSWNLYSFKTASARRDFFDYPHAGVGRDAIYMGANIFRGNFFKEGRVWAFDKWAMYQGQAASSVSWGLGSNEDTPQPLNLHGFNQGLWPSSGPHYILTETGYNGRDYTVFAWNDPFGANSFSTVGTFDLNAATGVSAGMPVNVPQLGGQTLQANDFRPQDFEYHSGFAWTSNTISCNPGGGTVDCVRWAQIDPASATVVDAGVYASAGEYRTFADLAVNACGDMAVGYTKSSSSMYPGIWYTGRQSSDPAGTLQAETELKAGEITYTSFESSAPRRWGDYTEMTIDPDGATFWYLGEYSKITGTSNGRWGTYIGSFSFGNNNCSAGGGDNPPTVNITNPNDGATVSGVINVTANASDDNEVSQVEFFVDGNSIGVDNDNSGGWSVAWNSTSVPDSSHTVSAKATDSIGQTGDDNVNVTVDNVADPSIHVFDIDGFSAPGNRGKWSATATITIHNIEGNLIANATVNGSWSAGASGSGSCETDDSGQCSITKNNIKKNANSVTFTVTDVSHRDYTYQSNDNHIDSISILQP
jgi:hypothetical protein